MQAMEEYINKTSMQNNRATIWVITPGAFLFNSIFWGEQLAINALLFDAFFISGLFYLYAGARSNRIVQYLLLAHLVALVTVIMYNSMVSKTAFMVTLLLLAAFSVYAHRSVWFAGGSLLLSFAGFTGGFIRLLRGNKKASPRKKQVARFIRFAIFPLLLAFFFLLLYSGANTVFAGVAGNVATSVERLFNGFFNLFSFERLLFLLFGFYLTGALLLRASSSSFEKREAAAADAMPRTRKKRMELHRTLRYDITVRIMGKLASGPMALKNEYKTGLISLVLLNGLLLMINCIDVNYLWIHFSYNPSIDLFTMIHEGTGLLIFSIVMAMLVLLIFFRGNLNFYKKNKWLKAGAYLWLLQNTVLVISVLLRDYYYIREFGLAYKRIGVLFFLLLVLAGLVTVFLKVRFAKSTYYLLRVNAWLAVLLLVAGSLVQWDVWIAGYNIAHRQTAPLNLPYLLTLSDKVLPVLDAHLPVLKEREKELNAKGIYMGRGNASLDEVLNGRLKDYRETLQQYSWLSWNYTDAKEKAYFLKKPVPAAITKE